MTVSTTMHKMLVIKERVNSKAVTIFLNGGTKTRNGHSNASDQKAKRDLVIAEKHSAVVLGKRAKASLQKTFIPIKNNDAPDTALYYLAMKRKSLIWELSRSS